MVAVTTNSVQLTLGYSGTDFTRKIKFSNVESGSLSAVKGKIIAYNANIPDADKKVFISDDYDNSDPENVIGEFNGIIAAQIQTDTEETIL